MGDLDFLLFTEEEKVIIKNAKDKLEYHTWSIEDRREFREKIISALATYDDAILISLKVGQKRDLELVKFAEKLLADRNFLYENYKEILTE